MKKRNLLLLVIMLAIGFAAVSTTLFINGTIVIGTNEEDFDVIFTEAKLDGTESSKAVISADKRKITFSSNKLISVGDSSTLEYKVKNNSTQYGANVTINCTKEDSEYISVSGEFDGKSTPITTPITMEAQEVKSGYISAELIKAYVGPDESIELTCEIVAMAVEADNVTDYQPDRYRESILNGADPVLANDLVPVTLSDDGTVTYADVNEEWYSYENNKWANAVILEDNVSYSVGDMIPEDSIESYFVWIPRYRYQIFNEGNYTEAIEGKPTEDSIAQEIQIEFEGKDITSSTGNTKNLWLTHPAFTNFDVNGLWVGKFETGYRGATSKETAQVDAIDSSKVIIKPNSYSWRNISVTNIFKTAYNYQREMDSHMMKNTEWGAVAYLSHSKYGINTEVRINNNSDYLTGYAATDKANQSNYPGITGTTDDITKSYNTSIGFMASTTGNITGIYDMSGGATEYMAAYVSGYGVQNDRLTKSGFTDVELIQYDSYLDKYLNNSSQVSYSNRILGDATGEMGPFYSYADDDGKERKHNNWYDDYSNFVNSSNPWFYRGSRYDNGVIAGQFYYDTGAGEKWFTIGYRLVLAP